MRTESQLVMAEIYVFKTLFAQHKRVCKLLQNTCLRQNLKRVFVKKNQRFVFEKKNKRAIHIPYSTRSNRRKM